MDQGTLRPNPDATDEYDGYLVTVVDRCLAMTLTVTRWRAIREALSTVGERDLADVVGVRIATATIRMAEF